MFGLGMGELAIVAVVLIVVVGPKHLPKLMSNMGRVLRGLRRATEDLKSTIGYKEMIRAVDIRKDISLDSALKKKSTPSHGAAAYRMTSADREQEYPTAGVDAHFAKLKAEADSPPEDISKEAASVTSSELPASTDPAPESVG